MSQSPPQEYVLGTHDAELMRLGFQHQVWAEAAYAQWSRAGFLPGHTLLDVGCGPGHTTRDLAQLVGPVGRVIAIDESQSFIDTVRGEPLPRWSAPIDARVGDVQRLDLPPESIDGAYSRWVLCFVTDPAAVVAAVARALRPGAAFAVQDYYRYSALTLAPPSKAFHRLIQAVEAAWRQHGGDPEVGCRLPRIFEQAGLELREVRALVRTARPHELLWQWPTTFFQIFAPTLVERGLLSAEEHAAFLRDWNERTRDSAAFFSTPPVIEIIGVKRA